MHCTEGAPDSGSWAVVGLHEAQRRVRSRSGSGVESRARTRDRPKFGDVAGYSTHQGPLRPLHTQGCDQDWGWGWQAAAHRMLQTRSRLGRGRPVGQSRGRLGPRLGQGLGGFCGTKVRDVWRQGRAVDHSVTGLWVRFDG